MIQYEVGRDKPSLQLNSNMSLYLRAGNTSRVEIVMSFVQQVTSSRKQSCDRFLEKLIVFHKQASNACYYNQGYDDYENVVPRFEQES